MKYFLSLKSLDGKFEATTDAKNDKQAVRYFLELTRDTSGDKVPKDLIKQNMFSEQEIDEIRLDHLQADENDRIKQEAEELEEIIDDHKREVIDDMKDEMLTDDEQAERGQYDNN